MVGRSDPKVVKGTDEHLKLERLDGVCRGGRPSSSCNHPGCEAGDSSIKGTAVDRDSWKEEKKN